MYLCGISFYERIYAELRCLNAQTTEMTSKRGRRKREFDSKVRSKFIIIYLFEALIDIFIVRESVQKHIKCHLIAKSRQDKANWNF